MMRILTALRYGLGLAILLSFLLSTTAFAQKTHKADTAVSQEETAKFEAEVRKMINRSGEGLTVYTLDNGAKVANLHGRFQSVALAKTDNNRNVSTTCVSTQKEANQFVKGKATKPAKKAGKQPTKKSAPAVEVK